MWVSLILPAVTQKVLMKDLKQHHHHQQQQQQQLKYIMTVMKNFMATPKMEAMIDLEIMGSMEYLKMTNSKQQQQQHHQQQHQQQQLKYIMTVMKIYMATLNMEAVMKVTLSMEAMMKVTLNMEAMMKLTFPPNINMEAVINLMATPIPSPTTRLWTLNQ
ncbi:uncharacterized protein LOC127179871 isoform X5 [Labeo rohita]|uniref:uncharacterized protein LOC127179871 isoform X5 n=1 Tax=Labeo rohita TaxID=84645 RepID=UPI0021E2854D|nr:uncharacterized protein LOC127179871 isoform X5 [Labeo rohita]